MFVTLKYTTKAMLLSNIFFNMVKSRVSKCIQFRSCHIIKAIKYSFNLMIWFNIQIFGLRRG